MTKIVTVEILISGIVQGVGFRPFLFNLARNFKIKGSIMNRGNAGVKLILQGKRKSINGFLSSIKKNKSDICFIENITIKEFSSSGIFEKLTIEPSEQGRGISLTLPPDIGICEECLKDMRNPHMEKYFMYPFTACSVCGPRYTTVTALPYDRERSTMNEFPFCKHAKPESCIQ